MTATRQIAAKARHQYHEEPLRIDVEEGAGVEGPIIACDFNPCNARAGRRLNMARRYTAAS